nr:hypothetical protein [Tanacetum cinerariifolium]
MHLGDHATHWANYLGELVRELSLHYPSWLQMPPERKVGVVAKIGLNPVLLASPDGIRSLTTNPCGYPAASAKALQWQEVCSQGKVSGSRRGRDLRRRAHQTRTSLAHFRGRLGCAYCILE